MVLILAEVLIGTFFLALVGLVQFLAPDYKLPSMVYWLLGTFVGADPQKVWMIAIPTLSGDSCERVSRRQKRGNGGRAHGDDGQFRRLHHR